MNTQTNFELLSDLDLLDQDISEIQELAGFEVPTPGEYILGLTVEVKAVNDKTSVVWNFRQVECIKQNDPEEKPTPADTKFSQMFMLQGEADKVEIAKRSLRTQSTAFAEAYGISNLLELTRKMLEMGEIMIGATVSRRFDKEDKEKVYPVIKNIRLA